jgi:hypothetical protein
MARNPKPVVANLKKDIMRRLLPVRVDYPKENESIVGADYSFRVVAPEASVTADVCIDQGEWQKCRHAVGFWWFDWSRTDEGEHEVVARVRGSDGTVLVSEPRIFFVKRG